MRMAVNDDKDERVRRFEFMAVLLDGTNVPLPGLPFIGKTTSAKREAAKRAAKFEKDCNDQCWVKDVVLI